jgi:hypothetical protein
VRQVQQNGAEEGGAKGSQPRVLESHERSFQFSESWSMAELIQVLMKDFRAFRNVSLDLASSGLNLVMNAPLLVTGAA